MGEVVVMSPLPSRVRSVSFLSYMCRFLSFLYIIFRNWITERWKQEQVSCHDRKTRTGLERDCCSSVKEARMKHLICLIVESLDVSVPAFLPRFRIFMIVAHVYGSSLHHH